VDSNGIDSVETVNNGCEELAEKAVEGSSEEEVRSDTRVE
jgi:hypothetical protein